MYTFCLQGFESAITRYEIHFSVPFLVIMYLVRGHKINQWSWNILSWQKHWVRFYNFSLEEMRGYLGSTDFLRIFPRFSLFVHCDCLPVIGHHCRFSCLNKRYLFCFVVEIRMIFTSLHYLLRYFPSFIMRDLETVIMKAMNSI